MTDDFSTTDEKIIKATFDFLQKEGFAKATTKKIAAGAGVNEVTIFRNFKNKKNLIETTKNYYLKILIDKLEEIFDFKEDEDIEEFLRISFFGILSLEPDEFSIIRVAMEEVRDVPDEDILISRITDVILIRLEDFFKSQKEKGILKDINTKSLAVMCFSSLFQSVILWKIYNKSLGFETNDYIDDLLDIFFEGILI